MPNSYLFDFDYTLADSSKGAIACITYALSNMQLGIPTVPKMKATIGMSLPATLEYLTGIKENQKASIFSSLFVEKADEVMSDMTSLFDYVPESINKLKNGNYKLGIISTKFRYRIIQILERYNLNESFDIILGGEDVSNQKPDSEGLLKAINHLDIPSKQVAYIGDSVIDAETAQNAKVSFLACLTGTTPKISFQNYPVTRFINGINELVHA